MDAKRLTNYLQRKRPVGIEQICHHFLVSRGTADWHIKNLCSEGKIVVHKQGKKHLYQEASFSPTRKQYLSIAGLTQKSNSEV